MAESNKFQVKLSPRAAAWVRYLAHDQKVTQSDLIRELCEDRLFLFNLPLEAHQRLAAAAEKRRMPLQAFLSNILTKAAFQLPDDGQELIVPGYKSPTEPDGPITSNYSDKPRKHS
jgi:hypothetical protein